MAITTPARVAHRRQIPPLRTVFHLPRLDAVTLLTFYLALTFLIPARLIVPGLGGAGRPSVLLGLGFLLWWLLSFLVPSLRSAGQQPIRGIVWTFATATLLTYGLGFARGLTGLEGRSADRYLIIVLSMTGVALLTSDGIRSRDNLDRLLLRCLWLGGFMAFVGTLQFLFHYDLVPRIHVPGLVLNQATIAIGARGPGFARVAGTTLHYIEFGVVLALLLPIAIHYAMFCPKGPRRTARWLLALMIGANIPFSVSRAGAVSLVIVAVTLFVVWSTQVRVKSIVVGIFCMAGFKVLVPGLLGTIRSLFLNFNSDPSVQGRTNDYAAVSHFIAERPWFGRGAGTFAPEIYRFLDNQYLMALITTGVVGLVALLILFGGGIVVARSTRRFGVDAASRHLGQAFTASMLAAAAASATFDSFSFPTFMTVVFLVLGAAGALRRLAVSDPQTMAAAGPMGIPVPAYSTPKWIPKEAHIPKRGESANHS
ncbi:MAG: O-antigen ligase family protein [Actinomycetota bacterium]